MTATRKDLGGVNDQEVLKNQDLGCSEAIVEEHLWVIAREIEEAEVASPQTNENQFEGLNLMNKIRYFDTQTEYYHCEFQQFSLILVNT